jgi:hypothetical protein
MTSRMSLSSSSWRISVLGPQRAVPSTPHLLRRQARIASAMLGPLLRTATTTTRTTTRRRSAAIASHWLVPPQLQLRQWVGAKAHEASSTPIRCPVVMTATPDAQCITLCTTARVSAGRSRSSRNRTAKSCINSTKKARLPASRSANKRWILRRRRTKRSHSRMSRGR